MCSLTLSAVLPKESGTAAPFQRSDLPVGHCVHGSHQSPIAGKHIQQEYADTKMQSNLSHNKSKYQEGKCYYYEKMSYFFTWSGLNKAQASDSSETVVAQQSPFHFVFDTKQSSALCIGTNSLFVINKYLNNDIIMIIICILNQIPFQIWKCKWCSLKCQPIESWNVIWRMI